MRPLCCISASNEARAGPFLVFLQPGRLTARWRRRGLDLRLILHRSTGTATFCDPSRGSLGPTCFEKHAPLRLKAAVFSDFVLVTESPPFSLAISIALCGASSLPGVAGVSTRSFNNLSPSINSRGILLLRICYFVFTHRGHQMCRYKKQKAFQAPCSNPSSSCGFLFMYIAVPYMTSPAPMM